MRQLFVFALLALATLPAHAGFIEIGLSGNYKRVNLAEDIYDESKALTGSISYMFDAMSAIELSYTDGSQKRVIGSTTGQDQTTTVTYSMVGLDFILTLGDRDAVLRPYIKGGAAYLLEKKLSNQFEGFPAQIDKEDPSLVPSVGAGFKLALSKNLSLKLGADAWTSKSISEDDYAWDISARAGLSWMF